MTSDAEKKIKARLAETGDATLEQAIRASTDELNDRQAYAIFKTTQAQC